MYKILFIITFFTLISVKSIGQQQFYVSDKMELANVLSYDGSQMLDTTSLEFNTIKTNVIDYCNARLDFNVDAITTFHSCREYKSMNPNTSKEQRKTVEKESLKYEFYTTLQIGSNSYYHCSFYLDSSFQVKHASPLLFNLTKQKISSISDWETISEKTLKYNNGWIMPMDQVDLEYSTEFNRFVYSITQDKNEKTIITEQSEYVYSYVVNKLVVDAENGKILEETTQTNRVMSSPSW